MGGSWLCGGAALQLTGSCCACPSDRQSGLHRAGGGDDGLARSGALSAGAVPGRRRPRRRRCHPGHGQRGQSGGAAERAGPPDPPPAPAPPGLDRDGNHRTAGGLLLRSDTTLLLSVCLLF